MDPPFLPSWLNVSFLVVCAVAHAQPFFLCLCEPACRAFLPTLLLGRHVWYMGFLLHRVGGGDSLPLLTRRGRGRHGVAARASRATAARIRQHVVAPRDFRCDRFASHLPYLLARIYGRCCFAGRIVRRHFGNSTPIIFICWRETCSTCIAQAPLKGQEEEHIFRFIYLYYTVYVPFRVHFYTCLHGICVTHLVFFCICRAGRLTLCFRHPSG